MLKPLAGTSGGEQSTEAVQSRSCRRDWGGGAFTPADPGMGGCTHTCPPTVTRTRAFTHTCPHTHERIRTHTQARGKREGRAECSEDTVANPPCLPGRRERRPRPENHAPTARLPVLPSLLWGPSASRPRQRVGMWPVPLVGAPGHLLFLTKDTEAQRGYGAALGPPETPTAPVPRPPPTGASAGTHRLAKVMRQVGPLGVVEYAVVFAFGTPRLRDHAHHAVLTGHLEDKAGVRELGRSSRV